MDPSLSDAEIENLTRKTQPAAQMRHLKRMGIRAERRGDGSVCVVREWLNNHRTAASQPAPRLRSDCREPAAPAR